jgi:hypothetical protein|tara:strand:+ start:2921 stop:3256 length:336 start_codon:yes stop_codon:yes gene_type:complete|mmetsp:Transcript_12091/g.56102  ORF Transcript_12091/g.56102 Transcript_12091/m.56102 type:complete len:112 (-) Transcript_12091:600-935(-)
MERLVPFSMRAGCLGLLKGELKDAARAAAASLAGDGLGVPSADQSPRATLAAACAVAATATKASEARIGLPSNSSLISTGEFLLLRVGDIMLCVGADLGGVMCGSPTSLRL